MDAAVLAAVEKFKNESTYFTQLYNEVMSGRATYDTAYRLSAELSRIYTKAIESGIPRVERLEWQQAHDIVGASLSNLYSETALYSAQIQKSLNQTAGVSMKAGIPGIDESRITHLEERLVEEPLEDIDWLFGDRTVSEIARAAVNDTIEVNAALQEEAGLRAIVERRQGPGGCCEWCAKMTGRYEMGSQPDDFFRVHANCNCSIDYKPSKRASWARLSYKTTTTKQNGKNATAIEKITEYI